MSQSDTAKKPSILETLFSWKMLAIVALGFSSGLPYLVTKDIIKLWLTEANADITVIGLFSAVGIPYTLKFLWSPIVDAVPLPFLGRRRSWMLVFQIAVAIAIFSLGQFNPATDLWTMALVCVVIAFFSASQDIVLDAFRREYLNESELAAGTGLWMNAYRLANLSSLGVATLVATSNGWPSAYFVVALMMGVGIVATIFVKEPQVGVKPPKNLKEAVVDPFMEFFKRDGALIILAFMMLYKLGDNMASAMNVPFLTAPLEKGGMAFTKAEYFVIVKSFGLAALFSGAALAGILMIRLGTAKALWVFGFFQMISTAGFAVLTFTGPSHAVLSAVVAFEMFSTGLGQTAFGTFIALQTNKKFTATQFALMTSFMAVPLTVASALTGFMVKYMGWANFYMTCTLIAIPGLLLLIKIAPWNSKNLDVSKN